MTTEATTSPPIDDARARLRQHFDTSVENHPDRWDHLWKAADFLPWDRGQPNPALVDTLLSKKDILGSAVGDGRRMKALVPGCGRGYDVLLLASFGYDAVGVETSEAAVAAAEQEKRKAQEQDTYPVADETVGRGSATFVKGDFFDDTWVAQAGCSDGFDLIYDYTVRSLSVFPFVATIHPISPPTNYATAVQFLCALPLALRPAWSSRMSTLLRDIGSLVCLEFPTYKDPASGGPPWALPPVVYEQHLARPGEDIPYDDAGYVIVVKEAADEGNDLTLVRVAHWQPERTHEIGKGTDWVSIWRHR